MFDAVSETMKRQYPSRVVEEIKEETYREKLLKRQYQACVDAFAHTQYAAKQDRLKDAMSIWKIRGAVSAKAGTNVFMTEPESAGDQAKHDDTEKKENEDLASAGAQDSEEIEYPLTLGAYPNPPLLKFFLTTKCMHQLIFQACLSMHPDLEALLKKKK